MANPNSIPQRDAVHSRALTARARVKYVVALALVAFAAAVVAWQLESGSAPTTAAPAGFKAARGDLTVTVGGVGRIVQAGEPTQAPTTAAGATPSGETPGFPVFARVTGQVTDLLVASGQHVTAGEPLALLDDGGVAAAAISQAQMDIATARVELRQKRTSDPLRGLPPTKAELAAGDVALTSARTRLARLLSPPPAADVSSAKLDIRRAEAELETLLGGTLEARADALLVARRSVELAQSRLDRILAPPHPADVAAAEADLRRAEADLEALVRSDRTQPVTQKEIDAAKAAITAARLKLERVQAPADPADVTAARVELERAGVDLRRLETGPSHTALLASRQAVEAARARLDQLLGPPLGSDVIAARLEIRRAEADLSVLRARSGPAAATDIELARLKVDGAKARLGSALRAAGPLTVRSPRSGTVTAVFTTVGAHADPATSILAIAELERLRVRVDLSEFDIAAVKAGQKARIGVDALGGKSIAGTVRSTAIAGTNASGVVTFPVEVELQDASGLKPGMNVSVRVVVATRRDVVQLPLEAVTQEGDEATVMVLDSSGQPVARVVKLGLSNNKNVEIVAGLRAGQRVVLEAAAGGGE